MSNAISKQFADFIEANTTHEFGQDLFAGFLPDEPHDCVVIYDTVGQSPETYLPNVRPSVQIIVRGEVYEDAFADAKAIAALLHRRMNDTLVDGGDYFFSIFQFGDIGFIGQDSRNRYEFSMNFQTYIRR